MKRIKLNFIIKKKGQQRTSIAVYHTKCVRMPMTKELTTNDVRIESNHSKISGVMSFTESCGTVLAIGHARWCMTHDVYL